MAGGTGLCARIRHRYSEGAAGSGSNLVRALRSTSGPGRDLDQSDASREMGEEAAVVDSIVEALVALDLSLPYLSKSCLVPSSHRSLRIRSRKADLRPFRRRGFVIPEDT